MQQPNIAPTEGFSEDRILWSRSLASASTEELADRLSNMRYVDSGIAFHRALADDRDGKNSARAKICGLLSRKQRERGLSILTMPGIKWSFEKLLLEHREPQNREGYLRPSRTFITAIERNEYLYRAAVYKMPGRNDGQGIQQREAPPYATCSVRTSNIGRFHRCSFEELATWYAAQTEYGFDAAWLDFSGNLTPQRLDLIEQFWRKNMRWRLFVTAVKGRHHLGDFNMREWMGTLGKVIHFHEYGFMAQVGIEKLVESLPGGGRG